MKKSVMKEKVIKMSTTPRYVAVYTDLKKQIREGEMDVGDFLPVEAELEKIYNVSRTTIRNAIKALLSEGYVDVKQGRGTQVLDFRSTQQLNCVTSLSETLRNKGYEVVIKSIYIDVVNATKNTATRLEIKEGDAVYHVQRVLLADGMPTAILENFIPTTLAEDIDLKMHEIKSLYGFLEEEYAHHIDSSKDIISAKSADFIESQMLDVKPGAALITIRRITYCADKPLTYDKTIVRADKYQLQLLLKGRMR